MVLSDLNLPLPSLPVVPLSAPLTDRQNELWAACNYAAHDVKLLINVPFILDHETISLDIEHDELGAYVGLGIYYPPTRTCHYFSDLRCAHSLDLSSVSIVAHNGKTDIALLQAWGFKVSQSQLVHDTQLIGHILDSSLKAYGLKAMAKRDLQIEYPDYDDIVGKKTAKVRVTLDQQPVELVSAYNCMDCLVTWKLYEHQINQCSLPVKGFYQNLARPLSLIFSDMENRGIRVDLPYLNQLKEDLEAQKRPLEEEIKNELGAINLNSPKQLLGALHAKEIYPELKGKPSTDKRALERLRENMVIQALLRYSELETLLSSFVYPYLERGTEVVHPYFNQTGTRTGRLSCSNPNLLQIPRRTANGKLVRRMFIPRDGFTFGDCDFGQIEPRLLAHLSQDPALCQMFNEGVDFHDFTAERLSISRDAAKVLNLSVGYRATFKSVGAQLKIGDKEADKAIYEWWELFPHLKQWQERTIWAAKKSGYVETLMGRRIKVDGLTEGNRWKREAAERQLINNLAQGSAAEVMQMAMLGIANSKDDLTPSFGLLVQVYDELLFESTNIIADSQIVLDKMINSVKLNVPLTVDFKIGNDWASCH